MKTDLVPDLPPPGGYENIATAMRVFSPFLFAHPISNQDAKTINKILNIIMTKHAYLTTTLISDKGWAFVSHVSKEVAGVLGITRKHATTEHAQTIGRHERSHASIKRTLKVDTGEQRSLWHKYVTIAVLNYNTYYHANIDCEPSRVFYGRIPYIVLDFKVGIHPQKLSAPNSQIAQDALEQTKMFFQDVRKNAKQAYTKSKAYYDKKAHASKLKQADHVYAGQPKADHQGSKLLFFRFSMDAGLTSKFWKCVNKQHLFGRQNWHQKDAGASSNGAAPLRTPPTYTGYTTYTTWVGARPKKYQ